MIALAERARGHDRRQIFLFLVAGAANTLFGYAVFSALVLVGLSPAPAAAVAAIAGILFNFRTLGMVFADRDPRRFLRFVGVYALLIALNLVLLHLLIGAGLHALVAQALVLPLFATLSFLLMRGVVFARGTSR
jgi:putative flippase GtrA